MLKSPSQLVFVPSMAISQSYLMVDFGVGELRCCGWCAGALVLLEKKGPTASRQVGLAGSFRRRSGYCCGGSSGVGWGGGSSKGNPFASASAFSIRPVHGFVDPFGSAFGSAFGSPSGFGVGLDGPD